MYLESQTHRDAISQIHRISGSLKGFEKMLLQRDASDILVQLLAIQGSLTGFASFMDQCIRKEININLHTPLPANQRTPARLQTIENIKVQLNSCTMKQLLQIMYTLRHQKISAE